MGMQDRILGKADVKKVLQLITRIEAGEQGILAEIVGLSLEARRLLLEGIRVREQLDERKSVRKNCSYWVDQICGLQLNKDKVRQWKKDPLVASQLVAIS